MEVSSTERSLLSLAPSAGIDVASLREEHPMLALFEGRTGPAARRSTRCYTGSAVASETACLLTIPRQASCFKLCSSSPSADNSLLPCFADSENLSGKWRSIWSTPPSWPPEPLRRKGLLEAQNLLSVSLCMENS